MKTELEKARRTIDKVDRKMAPLFEARMQAVGAVAAYKAERGLPIFDRVREEAVVEKNTAYIKNPALRPYYAAFVRGAMGVSRRYQAKKIEETNAQDGVTTLTVTHREGSYAVTIGRGLLPLCGHYFPLERRVLIVTDEGVPSEYAEAVAKAAKAPVVARVPRGEGSKSLAVAEQLLQLMLDHGFTRTDAIVAVGGGVCGDLGGFVASTYMRGIDFYNIPTTLLSQVDSSIGGKTAVNLGGVKNAVGAFYPPRGVLIDMDTLKTLAPREVSAGLAEAIKMAATFDEELFCRMENAASFADIADEVIVGALKIKRRVVEEDEKETSLRRALNFGHTLGHGYESAARLTGLLHGECVALGMLRLSSEEAKARLLPLLEKAGLPTSSAFSADEVLADVLHDKKADGDTIRYIYLDKIGSFCEQQALLTDFCRTVKENWE